MTPNFCLSMMSSIFANATRSPETELIVRTIRGDESDKNRISQLLGESLQWDKLLADANRHAVIPLLFKQLVSAGVDAIPAAFRSNLEAAHRLNVTRNMAATAELFEILNLCRQNSIPCVPVKGVVLSQQLYGDLGMRVSSDIDLLVRKEDASRLRQLLGDRGYGSSLGLFPHSEADFLAANEQLPLAHRFRPTAVEIHTALLPRREAAATTLDSFRSRLEKVAVGNQLIEALPLDEMLLYLCVHGAKHCWERLGWVCDVAEIIRRKPDLDWQAIRHRAEKHHWEKSLLLGLLLARELLGAKLPSDLQRDAQSMAPVAEVVAKKLFGSKRDNAMTMWRLWFYWRCNELWRDRLWYLWEVTARPTAADWKAVSLPPSLSFLYFPYRQLRLVAKYTARAISASTKRQAS